MVGAWAGREGTEEDWALVLVLVRWWLSHPGPTSDALLPRAVVLSGLENTTSPCQHALSDTLLKKRIVLEEDEELGVMNRPEWVLPEDFILVLVCPWDPRERPAIYKGLVCSILLLF